MLPKFFCAIQGVKDDFVLISHSLTISSTLYMVLQHITKRVGYLFVEQGRKILYCDASQAIAQRAGKMSKPVSAKFIEIWIPRQIDHLQGRFELWKQSHAGVYRLVSIAGSARISQCIKKRFTDRTWGPANLK